MGISLLKKAKRTKSVNQLLQLASENDYPLEEEEAKILFRQLHKDGELSESGLEVLTFGERLKRRISGRD